MSELLNTDHSDADVRPVDMTPTVGAFIGGSYSLLDDNSFNELEDDMNPHDAHSRLVPVSSVEHFDPEDKPKNEPKKHCHKFLKNKKNILNILLVSLVLLIIIWLVYATSGNSNTNHYASRTVLMEPAIGPNFHAYFSRE